jgi:CheY-like chemotaxis protein
MMPGMSGYEVAEQVAKACPQIRVLYMSGYPAPILNPPNAIDDVIRLVSKPFIESDLLSKIRAVLDT